MRAHQHRLQPAAARVTERCKSPQDAAILRATVRGTLPPTRVTRNDRLLAYNEEPPLGSHLVSPRLCFAHHGIYVGGGGSFTTGASGIACSGDRYRRLLTSETVAAVACESASSDPRRGLQHCSNPKAAGSRVFDPNALSCQAPLPGGQSTVGCRALSSRP
jgi:hypothetical protein